MFGAYELIGRARLMINTIKATTGKTHGSTGSALNIERKLENVPADFVDFFNILHNARDGARYNPRVFKRIKNEQAAIDVARREVTVFHAAHG